jgi:hypothetical protein
LLPIYQWFSTAWSFVIGDRAGLNVTTAQTASEDRYKKTISRLVAAADLGIESFEPQTIRNKTVNGFSLRC